MTDRKNTIRGAPNIIGTSKRKCQYFKIGGKSKKKNQIAGIRNAFVVQDDIEYGHTNVVPLWLFGFLY